MNNHIEVIKAQKTGLFTNYIFKAIPLAFDESMSYYECLCGLLDYLKNTIIPTVNNNADAVIELQNNVDTFETNISNSFQEFTTDITSDFQEFTTDITNDFNDYKTLINNTIEELENFVNNYFDNLDVQDEIDNKLDEMVQDGTMDQIVNTNITGTLSNLNTTNKTNLVNAINEVNNKTDIVDNKLNYSSNEIIVGKWIDNKPLYRKVISSNNLTPTSPNYLNIAHGISNLDKIVSLKTIAKTSADTFFDFNNYTWYDDTLGESSFTSTLHVFIDTQNIIVDYQGTHYIDYVTNAYFILEYTKTTD